MIVTALAIGMACVGVSPALARTIHVFSGTIGTEGSGAGELAFPWDVAVNDSTGDIYVADAGNNRVDEFGPSGAFIAAWGDDVDQTTGGNICTSASGDACRAGTSASTPGAFELPAFVAVDNSGGPSEGDVYVGDFGDNLVTKFTSDGTLVSSWGTGGQLDGSSATNGPFGRIVGVAVDRTGNLWVYDNNANMFEFTQAGAFATGWNSGVTANLAGGIAVDSADNLYVLTGEAVEEFGASGRDLGNVTADVSGDSIAGVAVDPATNDVYANDLTAGGASLIHQYSGAALSSCVPAGSCASVDEFDSGDLSSEEGLAFNAANGTVYAAEIGRGDVALFTAAVIPDVSTGQATGVSSTGATVTGMVNPDGTTVTDCHFEYVAAAGYHPTASDPYSGGDTIPCSSTPSGSSPVAVSASLPGLTPGTVYHFRLDAANTHGSSSGSDETFVTGPVIDQEFASTVGTSSATVDAAINPEGLATIYHFEYGSAGPCSSNPCTSVPVPDAVIGSQTTDQTVELTLTGLAAGTKYSYRVVATNSIGTTDGPDQTFTTYPSGAPPTQSCPSAQFRTGPAAGLPDCRAYELVAPPGSRPYLQDTGVNLRPVLYTQAASTGGALGWLSYYPPPGAQSNGFYFLSTRSASGWSTQSVIPNQNPQLAGCGMSLQYSADLSQGVLSGQPSSCGGDDPLLGGEPAGARNLFLRDTARGSYQLLNAPASGIAASDATFQAASADFSHIVFDEAAPLTAGAPTGDDLYEWADGAVRLVTVLPDGTPVQGTLPEAASTGGSFVGGAQFTGATSSDGSRVFFTAGGNLYVRENPTAPQSPISGGACTVASDACTVQVDAPQGSGPGGGGKFMWASSDGSQVYFTDDASAGLTSDSVAGSGTNLYDYDVGTGHLADLTAAATAQVQGVSGVSSDGSFVYFVADGALATGATGGQPNLYLYHGGATTFIATLANDDSTDWGVSNGVSSQRPYDPGDHLSARVSPSGRFIAFNSIQSLTGYDSTPETPADCRSNSTGTPIPCDQIYAYDAGSGRLRCASCNPSGAAPTAPTSIEIPEETSGGAGAGYLQRYLTDDGIVFFDSPDALLPGASDGQSNVYESEPDGVGSCAQAGGCLYLISSGTSANGSFFYDASATGNDVFFVTTQDLLGSQGDGDLAIYDARVDGGFPASATPTPACVDSATCQGSAGSAPTPPSIGTVSFSGPGNVPGSAPLAKVGVARRAVKGDSFALVVRVPAAGRITVTGAKVTRASRTVARAGSYRITVRLSRTARRALKRRRKLTVKLHVGYVGGGSSSVASVAMTVKA